MKMKTRNKSKCEKQTKSRTNKRLKHEKLGTKLKVVNKTKPAH